MAWMSALTDSRESLSVMAKSLPPNSRQIHHVDPGRHLRVAAPIDRGYRVIRLHVEIGDDAPGMADISRHLAGRAQPRGGIGDPIANLDLGRAGGPTHGFFSGVTSMKPQPVASVIRRINA